MSREAKGRPWDAQGAPREGQEDVKGGQSGAKGSQGEPKGRPCQARPRQSSLGPFGINPRVPPPNTIPILIYRVKLPDSSTLWVPGSSFTPRLLSSHTQYP